MNITYTLEFSIKSGQHGNNSLSLVQNRVRFKKNLQKSTLPFNRVSNSETHQFLCQTEFDPILTRHSFFLSASAAATYIFTAPTCTTTIITSIPRLYKTSFLCAPRSKRVKTGPKTGWRQYYFKENSIAYSTLHVIVAHQ